MAKITAQEFAEKWGRRLKSATQDIARGVQNVQESPGKRAAQSKDKWVAKMTDPTTHEKWANNVASVSVEDWKSAMLNVGVNRIAGGADRAQPKVADFASKLLSYQDQVLPKIRQMPSITYEDSKNRMLAWFDAMSKFQYKK